MGGVPKWSASAVLAVLGISTLAFATPYWIAWEGNGFPENQGWTRVHGPNGAEDVRTLQDGVMTLDGLQNPGGEYDGYVLYPSQGIQRDVGETFVAEWRLRTGDVVHAWHGWDPTAGFHSSDGWSVAFEFGTSNFIGVFELGWSVTYAPRVWHTFRLESADLRTYELKVDGETVREGVWVQTLPGARAAWGDGVVEVSSESSWDYFRFGVVPEPGSGVFFVTVGIAGLRWFRVREH